ncbi:MAG: serine/threonine-protein kinase, partial [Vulcanimicrobiaceae bacterium]
MFGELASGGMATVHLGRLAGAAGFARIVAIKALRPQYAEDPEFVSMFIDEARLAARIHHPNVVPTLDVVSSKNELFTVMDYVHGETLSRLVRASRGALVPLPIVAAVLRDVLSGLHAAHESTNEHGEPLGVVHRDVSPQNVIVGADGISRVLDFGVAKASGRIQTTREGQLKGKIAYMAPEQITSTKFDRRADVFALGCILYEVTTGLQPFLGDSDPQVMHAIMKGDFVPPGKLMVGYPHDLEKVIQKALSADPKDRFATADQMKL